ncbi:MAG: UvrD-helicase domain-containing protein, partial [Bacteroides sp.]|nr:UvrD-helicase domain-containing protein [Bacteroides sp.]
YGIWTIDKGSSAYMNELVKRLGLPEEEIRRKAGEALTLMIHDYSRFRVETIDSFFQSVMRNMARELELGANLNIDLDNYNALSEAVDSMIEKLDRNSPVLYWLLDYIDDRIRNDKQWKVANELKEFGRDIFNEEYIEKGIALRRTLEDKDCIKNYRKVLTALEEEVLEQMKGFGQQFFDTLSMHKLSVDDLSYKKTGIASYFNKLMAGEISDKVYTPRVNSHSESADFWTSKKHERRDEIITLAQNELIPLLDTAEEFRKKNKCIVNSCRLSLQHVNNVRLLANIDEEMRALNHEKNRFLLSDTNALLHGIVREGDPSFVFEKIGTNIHHVMIDEFQDTSRMQWANFKLLLMEGLARGADSLIVGDVKQSIYRWRGGDWNILNNLHGKIGPFPVKEEALKVNRRSEENIVRFNNDLFTAARKFNNNDFAELQQAYNDVEQDINKNSGKGYVKVSFLSPKEEISYEEDTLAQLTAEVDRLVAHGVKLNDMAILIRKNRMIPLIADYFDKHTSYRIVSDEAFRLDASLAVCMLIDALRCLSTPDDRIAKAQLAASYQNEVLKKDIDLNSLLLHEMDDHLPEAFVEHQDTLRLMPLYELLEKLFRIFQLSLIEEQDAYLFAFYDKVSEYLKEHSSELTAFIAYWEETLCAKTIPSGEIEGIRILSIHKSKGLEYPTVFLPFCDWKLENERISHVWCAPQQAPFNTLDLVPVNYGSAMDESVYHKDYLHEKLQLWVDNLNLLYVAFTRPKTNFVVWCKEKGDGTVSQLVQDCIKETLCTSSDTEAGDIVYELGDICPSVDEEGKIVTNKLMTVPESVPISMESLETPIEFKQSNRSADFIQGETEDRSQYIRQGELLHNLFACIRTSDDIPMALAKLRMEGIITSDEQERQIRKLVEWALGHPKVKEWFSGNWELYNECAIIYTDRGELQTRRPDRVMMKDGEVVVVDFKFGKKQASYHKQVRDYMSLLASMGYSHIRGYLWYVFNNELEEVN